MEKEKSLKLNSLENSKFGKLTALYKSGIKGKGSLWECKCDCGNYCTIARSNLISGNTNSCGCILKELNYLRCGVSKTENSSYGFKYRMYHGAKQRASKEAIPFDLEIADIEIPRKCPILGIDILVGQDREKTPSLDRIVPSKGYVKGNIQVISMRANRIKSDASLEELEKICDYIKNNKRT